MTQEEIANKLNINLRTLSNWKKNRKEVYNFIVEKIKDDELNKEKGTKDYIQEEMFEAIKKLPEAKAKKFYYLMMAELTEMGHQMAVFCPKCDKKTYNEFNCDYCDYEIKKNKRELKFRNQKKYMLDCEICGEKIAINSTNCPHCGNIKTTNIVLNLIQIIFIFIVALFIIDLVFFAVGLSIINWIFNDMLDTIFGVNQNKF